MVSKGQPPASGEVSRKDAREGDDWIAPDAIEAIFDRIAERSGHTRSELDAAVEKLSEVNTWSGEHVNFDEASNFGEKPSRTEHVNACDYCQRFVATMNPTALDMEVFQAKLTRLLDDHHGTASAPSHLPQLAAAAAIVILLAVGVFLSFHTWRPASQVRSVNSTESGLVRFPTSGQSARTESTNTGETAKPEVRLVANTRNSGSSEGPSLASIDKELLLMTSALQPAADRESMRGSGTVKNTSAARQQLQLAAEHIQRARLLLRESQTLEATGSKRESPQH